MPKTARLKNWCKMNLVVKNNIALIDFRHEAGCFFVEDRIQKVQKKRKFCFHEADFRNI